jgi:hypothetical protein
MMTDLDTDIETTREAIAHDEMQQHLSRACVRQPLEMLYEKVHIAIHLSTNRNTLTSSD